MKFIRHSLSQHEEIEHRADGNKHHQRKHEVLLDASCLDRTQFPTKPVGHVSRAITEEAIDDRQIDIIANEGTKSVCKRTEDVQDAVNHALIHKFVDDILREPVGRFDEHTIIEFVKIIFVLEQRDLQSVF